jgi:hypothetical protein
MPRAVTVYWPPAPPRLVAISSALLLFAASAISLLLYPTLFSATTDASPADVVDLNSWLDLPASVAALVVTLRPFAGDLFLGRPANLDWRASGLFRTPPNTVLSYQPAILFLATLVGLYSLVALFSTINAALYLFMGEVSWHSIVQGILRPVIAWVLVARVVRQMGAPSTGSAPYNKEMKSDVE